MKKITLLLFLMAFSVASFSQQIALTKDDYLAKSKSQKKIATILFISGTAVAVIGTTIWLSEFNDVLSDGDEFEAKQLDAGAGIAVAGGTLILASIPFYISAGKNKKLAMSLSFKNVPVQQIQQSSLVLKNTPSLTLKFSL